MGDQKYGIHNSGFNELEFNYIAMVHSILHKNVIVSICLYTSVGVSQQ